MNPTPQLRWQKATIEKTVARTPRVRSFFLKLTEPFLHMPGQHVDVRLTAPDGYQARRGYSIASAPMRGGLIELCIEELEGGEVSPFFHEVASTGDEIELRGPLGGHFVWTKDSGGPVLLIAGGSGVVPLVSMARHRAALGADTPMALLYSARKWDEVIFRDELLEMHGRRDGFDLVLTLTREAPERDDIFGRRLDPAMVLGAIEHFPVRPKLVFICGSNGFVSAASAAAIEAGVDERAIRTERYGG